MKLLVNGLVIILIIQSSNANMLSKTIDFLSSTHTDFSSTISTIVNATSNITVSTCLNLLNITEDGIFNLTDLIQELNLTKSVNITTILISINVTATDNGLVDLKSVFQNFNLTNVNFSNVLSLLNVTIADGVLDFTSVTEKIASYANFTEYISSLTMNIPEDGQLNFTGLAQKYIGPVKQYNVTTDDGYILTLFNVPSKNGSAEVRLCSHGVLSSSDDWILRGNTSLVYMLAENGYDVWVMNYRGNRYSRSHTKLDPDTDTAFWQYSMQEFGYYDLAAVIDFVLNKTGQTQLSVIGHSEGTSAVFVLTSTRPAYNAKIKEFVALSPVAYFSDSGTVLTTVIRLAPVLNEIFLALGIEELLGYNSLERKLLQLLCSQGTIGYDLCVKVGIAAIAGYDPDNLEPEFLLKLLGHSPAGTSRKNLIHYAQNGNSDRFAQYDYGSYNAEVYGTEIAPEYDLANVTCNVILFMGKNDLISGPKAGARLKEKLPNVKASNVVDYDLFNHLDFLIARNASTMLYSQVIDELN